MRNSARKILPAGLLAAVFLTTSLAVRAQVGYDRTILSNYYQKQDFDGAVQYLKSFTAGDEALFDYNRDLGYALYMDEAFTEAKTYLKKASLLQPGDITSNLCLAQLYNSQGSLDSSLYFYNLLILSDPGQYRFRQKAAGIYYRMGKLDSAFLCYQQAYRLNNRSGRIATDLSNLLIQRKQVNSADSLIREFLSRDSLDEDVIAKRIEISFKKGLYDTVIHWGEKLWQDSSLLNLPFVSLAYSYLNKEQYGECLALCKWLDEANRAGQAILYCAALAYSKTGHYIESNEKLDLCIKMSIQDDAHTYLAAKGDNFENMKNYKKAISYYDTAWYIFHRPFDLYFAGRIYDKYYNNPGRTLYYYRLFQKNKPSPGNFGEKRVIDYVDERLKDKGRKKAG